MRNPITALFAICAVALAQAPAAQATGKRIHKISAESVMVHPIRGYELERCHYGPGHPPLYPPVKSCSGSTVTNERRSKQRIGAPFHPFKIM
jgi:hypothetical protein